LVACERHDKRVYSKKFDSEGAIMASKKKHQNIHTNASAVLAGYEAKQAQAKAVADRKKADNKRAVIIGISVLAVAGLLQLGYFGFGPGRNDAQPSTSVSATPSASASNSKLVPSPGVARARVWSGTMNVAGTDLGIQLDGKSAPQAVSNFITLAQQGFFNGLKCHRLTTAGIFVLQCGDPNGDGTGGPGYNWGPIENAPTDNIYKTGVLAMARVGNNASSMGSQFFIVYKDSPIPADSVGGYTVFGKVTTGLEAVAKIAKAGVTGGGSDGKPALEAKLGAIVLK
jgi:peptidyl-prolyl cis-trans isomerase B (cyclophilin B)